MFVFFKAPSAGLSKKTQTQLARISPPPPQPHTVACNYSANAYFTANLAIHPYWFKEFGLDRWCRRDVCASVWTTDHSHDLIFKVTDVCDPRDCPTPFVMKAQAWKASYLFYHRNGQRPTDQMFLYWTPCWADGIVQPDFDAKIPGPPLR